ncbi:MAG: hypothetical protein IKQ61_01395 [Spirochaetales bacterium]|nr:hypothetical protein [Spirochaetales bacterium]
MTGEIHSLPVNVANIQMWSHYMWGILWKTLASINEADEYFSTTEYSAA